MRVDYLYKFGAEGMYWTCWVRAGVYEFCSCVCIRLFVVLVFVNTELEMKVQEDVSL